jgi:DNA-directed RNA polymerase specialized sigma24 family protein
MTTFMTVEDTAFEQFLAQAQQRLRRAFVIAYGVERADEATAEAIGWAWEHRAHVSAMDNPVGYLYRVGQSRTRQRVSPVLPEPDRIGLPDIEPGLIPALQALPDRQRVSVWLVHACGWHHSEVAEALGVSTSSISTHTARGLAALRAALGGELS